MSDLSNSLIGQLLNGRYRIVRPAGEGGMSDVFLADDSKIPRKIAVKVFRFGTSKNFKREVQAIAALDHRNIVKIYDADRDDKLGVEYIAMQWMEAGSLKVGARYNLPDAVSIIKQLAEALHYAHGKGIIHRDVKHSNIMIGEQGNPILIDFSIATGEGIDATRTNINSSVGTFTHMSPEQAQGLDLTPATDQYSLGIIAYHMITGELPFNPPQPTPMAYMFMHMTQQPPVPWNVPESVSRVLLKSLAKQPSDRYPSVLEFAIALEKAAQDPSLGTAPAIPITNTPPPGQLSSDMYNEATVRDMPALTPEMAAQMMATNSPVATQAQRPTTSAPAPVMPPPSPIVPPQQTTLPAQPAARRGPPVPLLLAGIVGVALCAVLSGIVLAVISNQNTQQALTQTAIALFSTSTKIAEEVNSTQTQVAINNSVALTAVEGTKIAFLQTATAIAIPTLTFTPAATVTPIPTATASATSTDLPTVTLTPSLTATDAPTSTPTATIDEQATISAALVGTATAFINQTATEAARPTSTSTPTNTALPTNTEAPTSTATNTVAATIPPTVNVAAPTADSTAVATSAPSGSTAIPTAVVITPSGATETPVAVVTVITATGTAAVTLTPTTVPTRAGPPTGGGSGKIVFKSNRSSNGGENSDIYIFDVDTKEYIQIKIGGIAGDPYPAPDGKQIVFTLITPRPDNPDGSQLYLINVDGTDRRQLTTEGDNYNPAWSPDGKTILFVSTRDSEAGKGKNYELYSMSPDGSNQKRISNTPAFDAEISWARNGRRFAFTSDRPGLLQVFIANADGTGVRRVTNTKVMETFPDLSPDGAKVLYLSDRTSSPGKVDNRQWFVMTVGGEGLTQLTTIAKPNPVMRARWSPDGKKIVFNNTIENGNWAVFIMNADGSDIQQLTDGKFSEGEGIRWMP
jgi:serine/threonine-protein kinase